MPRLFVELQAGKPGARLVMVGGHKALGWWDPARGASLEWTGRSWELVEPIILNGVRNHLDYKFVRLGEGPPKWEEGRNRVLVVPSDCHGCTDLLLSASVSTTGLGGAAAATGSARPITPREAARRRAGAARAAELGGSLGADGGQGASAPGESAEEVGWRQRHAEVAGRLAETRARAEAEVRRMAEEEWQAAALEAGLRAELAALQRELAALAKQPLPAPAAPEASVPQRPSTVPTPTLAPALAQQRAAPAAAAVAAAAAPAAAAAAGLPSPSSSSSSARRKAPSLAPIMIFMPDRGDAVPAPAAGAPASTPSSLAAAAVAAPAADDAFAAAAAQAAGGVAALPTPTSMDISSAGPRRDEAAEEASPSTSSAPRGGEGSGGEAPQRRAPGAGVRAGPEPESDPGGGLWYYLQDSSDPSGSAAEKQKSPAGSVARECAGPGASSGAAAPRGAAGSSWEEVPAAPAPQDWLAVGQPSVGARRSPLCTFSPTPWAGRQRAPLSARATVAPSAKPRPGARGRTARSKRGIKAAAKGAASVEGRGGGAAGAADEAQAPALVAEEGVPRALREVVEAEQPEQPAAAGGKAENVLGPEALNLPTRDFAAGSGSAGTGSSGRGTPDEGSTGGSRLRRRPPPEGAALAAASAALSLGSVSKRGCVVRSDNLALKSNGTGDQPRHQREAVPKLKDFKEVNVEKTFDEPPADKASTAIARWTASCGLHDVVAFR